MIIPLFGFGTKSKSVTVTAQRHINVYAEMAGNDADKSVFSYFGLPGLTLFTSFGDTPVRGAIAVDTSVYVVHRGVFWEINNAGVKIQRGLIGTSTGRVSMAFNGLQVAVVDGSSLWIYTVATQAFVQVTTGIMANPVDITYQDHYFIASFRNSGMFQISAIDDGLTWNALDFSSAESSPDDLQRVIADHGEIVLCGTQTVEFWTNAGNLDFPYVNQRGTTLQFGIAAPASLVRYNDSLAGLFRNDSGQVDIRMLTNGHALTKISTQAVDAEISRYSVVSDATAFSYMLDGHPMYEINFPTAGKTWLFDSSSGLWSELQSGLAGGRHRAEIGVSFQNRMLVTDYENGNVYNMAPDIYTENGQPIVREIVSRHLFKDLAVFRTGFLQVDMETGIGLNDGQGVDPQIMLQISRNNGHTFGNELWKPLGKMGNYRTRVIWRRLGRGYDFVFKLRMTDPVKFVLTAASVVTND